MRESVAPMSGAGEIVRVGAGGEEEHGGESETASKPAWLRTIFIAVLDAARGIGWSRESPADDPRRRRTQRRYIAFSATLLGLAAEVDEETVQRIAVCLGIAYLVLSDSRRAYRGASTYVGRGTALAEALELIPVDRTLAHRMLMAGFLGGLWGRPEQWDPG